MQCVSKPSKLLRYSSILSGAPMVESVRFVRAIMSTFGSKVVSG